MGGTVVERERKGVVTDGKGDARIVQLKSGHPGPCFFLVPGTGGRIEGFATLAALLQTSMPVFAIEARGVSGSSEPDNNIDELVNHYIQRIRDIQPQGPYFLLGHSFGGMVVFEIAQNLMAHKEHVACLILLDTVTPKKDWPLSFYMANIWTRVRSHFQRISHNTLRNSVTYYSRRLILRRYGLHGIPTDLKMGTDVARMLLANEMLGKKWKPKFYPGKMTLFCAPETKRLASVWSNRVAELDNHFSAGGHVNLIEQPYVSSLAADISTCLRHAVAPPMSGVSV